MKIALVTGASSGMGRDFIKEVAKNPEGIEEIWAVARRKERLDELSLLIDIPIKQVIVDLTEKESLLKLDNLLKEQKPKIHILINCAGFGKIGEFSSLSYQDNIGMVELNCTALTSISYMALPYMSVGDRIIQLASSAAYLPQPKFAVYAATKSYVLSLSRALSKEFKVKGITVTAVCPGPVNTEFFEIAETTDKIQMFKKLAMAQSYKVVQNAMKASKKGRTVVTYSGLMKTFRFLAKLIPHNIILKFLEY